MRVATWNVNGVRAREAQVVEFLSKEAPDVLCLQELKAEASKVPASLTALADYWAFWHGAGAYSGVALLLRKATFPEEPVFSHPAFDHENRIVIAAAGSMTFGSLYVPNGGKDFEAKVRFLSALKDWAGASRAGKRLVVLGGDLNVTRSEMDVHPKERKVDAIGQRPDERQLLEELLAEGLFDVARTLDPDNDQLFTWWAPWRNLRQRNIGWRLDYILASDELRKTALRCEVQREFGTSDHAPVVAELA